MTRIRPTTTTTTTTTTTDRLRAAPALALVAALLAGAGALASAPRAAAAQSATGRVASFTLPTTSGHDRSIAQYRGRVVILFYESRDAVSLNDHVKRAIGREGDRDPSMRRRFALVPVANVGAWAFWPAQHFAREAMTTVARSQGVELWMDWDRTLVRGLGLRDDTSNVVILDRQGRVRYHRWGRIPDAEVQPFLELLGRLDAER